MGIQTTVDQEARFCNRKSPLPNVSHPVKELLQNDDADGEIELRPRKQVLEKVFLLEQLRGLGKSAANAV